MVDVVSPKCITCKKIYPVYNYPDLPAKYCKTCSEKGMIDVRNSKCITCKK